MFVSPLKSESRLFKELQTAEIGGIPPAQTLTIGMANEGDEESGHLNGKFPYIRLRLKSRKWPRSLPFQVIKYLEWTFRAGAWARHVNPRIIQCHSLPSLPAAVIGKVFRDTVLIYDAHELETKRANIGGMRQKANVFIEKYLIRFVDEILVVSPSIKRHYEAQYPHKKTSLLMNLPSLRDVGRGIDFRENLGIAADEKVVLYLGGLSPMRGIDLLLEAAATVKDWQFVFMGEGPLANDIRAASVNGNVHLHSPVPEREILKTVEKADLTYCVIECSRDSYRFALPNKFFQSLCSGTPVLINEESVDMVEVGKGTGLVSSVPYEAEAVVTFLRRFTPFRAATGFRMSWEDQTRTRAS